jgi:hypothetical protein
MQRVDWLTRCFSHCCFIHNRSRLPSRTLSSANCVIRTHSHPWLTRRCALADKEVAVEGNDHRDGENIITRDVNCVACPATTKFSVIRYLSKSVANQGYLSWNRPDTPWPNLRPRSTTFIFTHSTTCTYLNLKYMYVLVYSVGESTQFTYAVVDAFSTAIKSPSKLAVPRDTYAQSSRSSAASTSEAVLFQ